MPLTPLRGFVCGHCFDFELSSAASVLLKWCCVVDLLLVPDCFADDFRCRCRIQSLVAVDHVVVGFLGAQLLRARFDSRLLGSFVVAVLTLSHVCSPAFI